MTSAQLLHPRLEQLKEAQQHISMVKNVANPAQQALIAAIEILLEQAVADATPHADILDSGD